MKLYITSQLNVSDLLRGVFAPWAIPVGNAFLTLYYGVGTGRNYHSIFLQQVLPQLQSDEQISVSAKQPTWFQHDEAPAHFSSEVHNFLGVRFGQQWIGRSGPVRYGLLYHQKPTMSLTSKRSRSIMY